ncbi:MAG TPA: histidine--tRNA ligase [Rhodospirillaceae bacterium]|nr:histidine--tRNA ligase [Rhodospirillaceae bacterium]
MADQKIYKPRPITGFPEWLPEVRRVEQQWMDHIRKIFESYGFCSIETPSVEEIDVLSAKGEVDKEIYVLERLHKDENEKSDARLALHFDQTVPLARYVAQHFNELDFPFKRYQMQRVWRGERPQAGRFREFYQCDIDVIGVDSVPIHFDGELAAIMVDILRGLNIGPFQMQISNRKILMGLCEGLGITDTLPVTRAIDKIEKIGVDGTRKLLVEANIPAQHIETLIKLATIKTENESFVEQVLALGVSSPTLAEGIAELASVMAQLTHIERGYVVADLSIVRGLDYYTGTVYETKLLENRDFGSICSGGRYDDLAGSYINKHLPGVGISIGLSRLFDYMRLNNKLGDLTRKSPTDILVCVPSDEKRVEAASIAKILRDRGLNVELYHSSQKIKKQMEYAVRKGIPFVWFPPFEDRNTHEVKNMVTGEQLPSDPHIWSK